MLEFTISVRSRVTEQSSHENIKLACGEFQCWIYFYFLSSESVVVAYFITYAFVSICFVFIVFSASISLVRVFVQSILTS